MHSPAPPDSPAPGAPGTAESEVLRGELLTPEQVAARAQVERLSTWLDTKFRIPGTNIRFGADAVAGVIPGIGDTAGLVASAIVIAQAVALGARGWVLVRMVGLASLDALVGTVPVLGTVFDVVFKANTRNVALLDRHITDPNAARAASKRSVALTAVVISVVILVFTVGVLALLYLLYSLAT